MLRTVFAPQCVGCGGLVESDFALCGSCWRDTGFVAGLVCNKCGVPLPGEDDGVVTCDDCLTTARPWHRGRAAALYQNTARRLILALKNNDRTELSRPMGDWMAASAAPIITPGMLVAPVPLHRWRLLKRRYNQAALLSARVAHTCGLAHCPDLLCRVRRTAPHTDLGAKERFSNLNNAIAVHKARGDMVNNREVLIVDDVMTSGATLAACAEVCLAAGASQVSVLVFARVAKTP